MRMRIRGPSGQSTISLADHATVADLIDRIQATTSFTNFGVKYGYPPKPLALDRFDRGTRISEIGVDLDGEQLIIIQESGSTTTNDSQRSPAVKARQPETPPPKQASETVENDPPEIASQEHGGTIVLRIMPDDNSCLFRAVGSAVLGVMDCMTELRSIVAQTIQEQPEKYTRAILEKNRDDYCRWIQTENAWGGGIELSILSKHFDVEICSIDVQTLRVDRFNEGQPTMCIVVYSGIHYDTIALSPSDPPFTHSYAPPEFDTKIFDSSDAVVLQKALELCRVLQQRHYYTDTAGFQLKCNVCGGMFVGENGAARHASETGHFDFGEAS